MLLSLNIMVKKLLVFSLVIFFASTLTVESLKFGNEYSLVKTVLLGDGSIKNVGYKITALLKLELLKKDFYLAKLEDSNLYIYSTKKKVPYGFVPYTSSVNFYNNDPFLIELCEGVVRNIFIPKGEDVGGVKIRKAIANLFQFQKKNLEVQESDLSGECRVKYVETPNLVMKIKDDCIPVVPKTVWNGNLISKRNSSIYHDGEKVVSISSGEEHILSSHLNRIMNSNFSSLIELRLTGSVLAMEKFPSDDTNNIVSKIETELGNEFETHFLTHGKLPHIPCRDCPKFGRFISENIEFLSEKQLGTTESAEIFLKATEAAKATSSQDIYNSVNAKKNRIILPQLMDILGASQTVDTHQAALKFLRINTEKYDLDLCERYFWALSMVPTVQPHLVSELQQLVRNQHKDWKLWQTIINTYAAVLYKYARQIENPDKIVTETIDFFANKIEGCLSDEECKIIYIKALSNFPFKETIPLLIKIVENSPKKSGARAMKLIGKMDSSFWDENVIQLAEKVLLSMNNYDSSAQVFAVDILLRSNPSYTRLSRILSILKHRYSSREVKEYLLQRLDEISESDKSFEQQLKKVLNENGFNDYDKLCQGGLSTSFRRSFMSSGWLSNSQEIVSGILKQGSVHVNLLLGEQVKTPFSLGMFAGGLSSFVSSEEVEDDELPTAGLELTVLGVELRPFVFFNGTGELMGHIWSGTASTLTPAYQALLLLEDSSLTIPLSIGESLDIKFNSAASVDLSGKFEVSLWNRNSKSLVLNRAAILIENRFYLHTPYVNSETILDMKLEPELHLMADSDFSDGSKLCLQLQQPNTVVKFESYKSQTLPSSSFKTKKSRILQVQVPGKTYSLNSKNNEMCKQLNV